MTLDTYAYAIAAARAASYGRDAVVEEARSGALSASSLWDAVGGVADGVRGVTLPLSDVLDAVAVAADLTAENLVFPPDNGPCLTCGEYDGAHDEGCALRGPARYPTVAETLAGLA